jgi:hypothetical protein
VALRLSTKAEERLDELEQSDQNAFDLVQDDLQLLEYFGMDSVELGAMFGQWARATGPTGRVTYWITPYGDDDWLIESIDII